MSKKETVITLDEWMEATFTPLPIKPDNSFTLAEICKKTKVNSRTMQSRLSGMVAQGKLIMGKCSVNSRIVNYYLPVEFTKKK